MTEEWGIVFNFIKHNINKLLDFFLILQIIVECRLLPTLTPLLSANLENVVSGGTGEGAQGPDCVLDAFKG